MLASVQMLRGLAAALVVLLHVSTELQGPGLPVQVPTFLTGAVGVDLFFVISGFVIAHTVLRPAVAPDPLSFLLRRLVRIVPLYWICTAFFVWPTIQAARAAGAADGGLDYILRSLAFIPAPTPDGSDILPVYILGWTLNYEMLFYVATATALVLPRRMALGCVGGLLTALVVLGRLVDLPLVPAYWAQTITLEFVYGLVIAAAFHAGWRWPRWVSLLLLAGAVAGIAATTSSLDLWFAWRGIVWGLPAAGIVALLTLGPPLREGQATGWLVAWGDASYALYLGHYLFIVAAERMLHHLVSHGRVPEMVYAAILLGGALATGPVIHRWVERPLLSRLKALLPGDRRIADAATAPILR